MDSGKKSDNWLLVRKDGRVQRLTSGMMFVGREECDVILQLRKMYDGFTWLEQSLACDNPVTIHLSDVVYKSASSDKRHAVLFLDTASKEIHIKDLNSLTGTYVNGIRIPGQTYVKLKHLDNVRFSYDVFHVQNYASFDTTNQTTTAEIKIAQQRSTMTDMHETQNRSIQKNTEPLISLNKNIQDADSLEDLRRISPVKDSNQENCLELNENDNTVVSPSFSSLTFKRRDTRVLDVPCDALLSSLSSDKEKYGSSEVPIEKLCDTPSSNPSSLDSAPLPMAFTVAFDNPVPKKKFSIRDSISKYAPRKAETERKKHEKTEPVKKTVTLENSKNGQIELRKKKNVAERTISNAVDSCELNSKTHTEKAEEPKLSHGATYLIQKMLKGGKTKSAQRDEQNQAACHQPPLNNSTTNVSQLSSPVEHPAGNEDSKSDTGTYTIEEELNDKIVKEAREKIDEVFGLKTVAKKQENNCQHSKQQINEEMGQQESPQSLQVSSSSSPDRIVVPPMRTKRRLPTPPVQLSSENSSPSEEKPYLSSYNTYSLKARPHSTQQSLKIENEQGIDLSYDDKRSSLKDRVSPNLMKTHVSNNKLTINNLELLQNSCIGGRNVNFINNQTDVPLRRTPPSTIGWRRPPYGFSGSDMDLDQIKAETSSVLSDVSVSTEPPSINPNNNRLETGPQMKFNRAFALRRARLGLETDFPGLSKSASQKDTKALKDGSRLAPPASPLSRQDGGRFSLRLPKSASKYLGNKSAPKTTVTKTPSSAGLKYGHRRIDSDPAKTAFLRKGIDTKMSIPDINKSKATSSRPSFQRAASFSNNNENVPEVASKLQKPHGWKQETLAPVALRRPPRYSQVPNKIVNNDTYSREHIPSGQSDKSDLSALDNLVIQATHQLSVKLKTIAHQLLVKERDKFTEDSSERLMIDEVLPRMLETPSNTCSGCTERGISQDLANTLKNLKRVEQSLEVLTIAVDDERMDSRRLHHHHHHHHIASTEDNLYVVDI